MSRMSCCVGMRYSRVVGRDLMEGAAIQVSWDLVVYVVWLVVSGFLNASCEMC